MDTDDLSEIGLTEVVDDVYLAQLSAGGHMSMQYFRIEPGAETPVHEHDHEQLGFIYEGEFTFDIDGEEYVISAGESYAIPPNEPHGGVNNGEETVEGVDIFSPPRVDQPWNQ